MDTDDLLEELPILVAIATDISKSKEERFQAQLTMEKNALALDEELLRLLKQKTEFDKLEERIASLEAEVYRLRSGLEKKIDNTK